MKILAIESSGTVASAALLEDDNVIIEKTGSFKVTHSETLMPMIDEVYRESGINPDQTDIIAVSGGPGSFTGLRIGSATAKGLGFALGKELVHVPTLNAMAYNFKGSDKLIVPVMDARRSQVYTGIYSFDKDRLEILLEGCAMAAADLVSYIGEHYPDRKVIFTGDGMEVVRKAAEEAGTAGFELAEGPDALQRAASVGKLGYELALQGQTVSADAEAPVYLRLSQAERVRSEQMQS